MQRIECTGEVSSVVIHARGALVTRRVVLPEGVKGDLLCVVPSMSDRVQDGSQRVRLGQGEAKLGVVVARQRLPEKDAEAGPVRAKVEELLEELEALYVEQNSLRQQIAYWQDVQISPGNSKLFRERGASAPIDSALGLVSLYQRKWRNRRERLTTLEREIEEKERGLAKVQLELEQANGRFKKGSEDPLWEVEVQLFGVQGLASFDLTYVVDEARWWPAYTIHLDSAGKEVTLHVEAMVAQDSGADWEGVELALSTAELDMDARLPELASLRIGRRQVESRRSGFRAPPEGLDGLFSGYDQALAKLHLNRTPPVHPAAATSSPAPYMDLEMEAMALDDHYGQPASRGALEQSHKKKSISRERKTALAPPSGPPVLASAAPSPSFSSDLGPERMKESFGSSSPTPLAGGGGPPAPKRSRSALTPAVLEGEIEPEEGWLHFDRLRIGGAKSAYRGKLYRVGEIFARNQGAKSLSASASAGLIDPVASRGSFDYRYDGDGLFSIPGDGQIHAISLRQAKNRIQWHWRSVPRVEKALYREVSFQNPLDVAILDGPVRVFLDGDFLVRTRLQRVDRGGQITLGLGVEERVQVIRNLRFDEEDAGLLKGKRMLSHYVETTLRSGLGYPIDVEILDRLPVSDEEVIKVDLVEESHRGEDYDQRDRGRPIRGGRRWRLTISPGGELKLKYTYQVQIRSKDELVGGNRREG